MRSTSSSKRRSAHYVAVGTLALAGLAAPAVTVLGVGPAWAAPTCHGKQATMVGTPGADRLVGTAGRDVIVAGAGDDVLIGRGGSDLLCGGPGADELSGGAGEDKLHGERDKIWTDSQGSRIHTGDILRGGLGDDLLDPGPRMPGGFTILEKDLIVYAGTPRAVRVDLSTGPSTGKATARGQGRDRIVWRWSLGVVGSHKGDRLVGSDGIDLLVGLAGNDRLWGHDGRDELYPDRASLGRGPMLRRGGGNDVVFGGDGEDDVTATHGRDEIHGGPRDDSFSLTGGRGHRVYGDDGGDLFFVHFRNARALGGVLDGGPSEGFSTDGLFLDGAGAKRSTVVSVDAAAERVVAESGGTKKTGRVAGFETFDFFGSVHWRFFGTDGPDELSVDQGVLRANGRGGDDYLDGARGRHVIRGGDGNDDLFGGPQADRLSGGPGDDELGGGPGDDRLIGNAGVDRVRGNQGRDTCDGEKESGCER